MYFFFFQAEDGIRDYKVTGVQTCALPIWWRHLTELLDMEPEALEEPLIDGAERRLRGAHSAQREEEGKFRLSRGHTRNLPSLDQQYPDSPAPTRIHIVQPIVNLRESSSLRVIVASEHGVEVERQRCSYLRSIEVRLLRLDQYIIERQGIEEIPSDRDRAGPRKALAQGEEVSVSQLEVQVGIEDRDRGLRVIVKGVHIQGCRDGLKRPQNQLSSEVGEGLSCRRGRQMLALGQPEIAEFQVSHGIAG